MYIVQQGIGHDRYHCYGACYGQITTYDPGYEKCGKTAGHGLYHTAEMAVIQLWQHHPGSAYCLRR